jgi:hypothetical protein
LSNPFGEDLVNVIKHKLSTHKAWQHRMNIGLRPSRKFGHVASPRYSLTETKSDESALRRWRSTFFAAVAIVIAGSMIMSIHLKNVHVNDIEGLVGSPTQAPTPTPTFDLFVPPLILIVLRETNKAEHGKHLLRATVARAALASPQSKIVILSQVNNAHISRYT